MIEIAREFEVSTDALLWRLVNLKLLSREEVIEALGTRVLKEMERERRTKNLTGEGPYLSARYINLAIKAFLMGQVSKARFAEYVGIPFSEVPLFLRNGATTRTRTTRLLLVLLDANAIIGFHELGVWGQIVRQHEVYIPSIVLRGEAFFYRTVDGRRHPIDLLPSAGKSITELECTPDEIEDFALRYNRSFLPEIHKGEQEALALLETRGLALLYMRWGSTQGSWVYGAF